MIEDNEKKIKMQKDKGDSLLNDLSKRLLNLQKNFKA